MRRTIALITVVILMSTGLSATFVASYYDSGSGQTPRYRIWNNTWSAEQSLPSAGANNNYWKVLRTSPEYREALLAFYNGNGNLMLYFFNGTGWETPQTLGSLGASTTYRPFDITYFNDTGDAMIVYADGTTTPKYRVWHSSTSTLGNEQSLSSIPSSNIYWIRLEAYNSTRAVALTLDANYDLYAQSWNGTDWSTATLIDNSVGYYLYQDFDIAFEHDTGKAVVAWGEGNNIPKYKTWDGSAWSAQASLNGVGAQPYWIKIRSSPSGNRMMFCSLDSARDLNCQPWNGSTWGTNTELNANLESNARPDFGLAYYSSTNALAVYGRRNINRAYYRTWNGNSWSNEAQMLAGTTDPREVELYPDPNSNNVMTLITDDGNDLNAELWDGSTWAQRTELETSSSRNRKSFSGAFFYTDSLRPVIINPMIVTDKLFYEHDENVTITGAYFTPDGNVTLNIIDPENHSAPGYPVIIQANSTGGFVHSWNTDTRCMQNYTVSAYDQNKSYNATTTFWIVYAFDDEFNDGVLNGNWTWINEPGTWDESSSKAGYLHWLVNTNTEWWGNGKGIGLVQAISGDFNVTSKMEYTASDQYHHIGLIVMQDGNDWVKLVMEYNSGAQKGAYSVVRTVAGSSTEISYTPHNALSGYLRVVRQGNTFYFYASDDNVTYQYLTSYTPASAYPDTVSVGLIADRGGSTTNFDVYFDWFRTNVSVSACAPFYIPPTPKFITVDAARYTNCRHTVYYKVSMVNGSSYYSVSAIDSSSTTHTLEANTSNTTYYGAYELSEDAPIGQWIMRASDLVWRIDADANFTVKVNPKSALGILISKEYYSLAKDSGSTINTYAVNGSTQCNITIHDTNGNLVLQQQWVLSGTNSTSLSSLGGGSWNYPTLIHLKCDKNIVATRGPPADGVTVFQNPSQLSDAYYGVLSQASVLRIGAPYSSVSYDAYVYGPYGTLKDHVSGNIPANGSSAINLNSPGTVGGLKLNATNTIISYYEPGTTLAIPYSDHSLFRKGLFPVYDKTGTDIYLYAPLTNANISIRIYPYTGYSPVLGYCEKNITITASQAWTDSISGILHDCGMYNQFGTGPMGSVIINSTALIAATVNSWQGSALDSPVYQFGEFYPHNYFVLGSSGIEYMVFSPYASNNFTVNGAQYQGGEYTITYGQTTGNYLNVSSELGTAVSSASGGSNTVVVVGE